MAQRVRAQQIRCRPNHGKVTLGGWLSGRNTYLWIGNEQRDFLGYIDGRRLYRLAKAIVRHYEAAK